VGREADCKRLHSIINDVALAWGKEGTGSEEKGRDESRGKREGKTKEDKEDGKDRDDSRGKTRERDPTPRGDIKKSSRGSRKVRPRSEADPLEKSEKSEKSERSEISEKSDPGRIERTDSLVGLEGRREKKELAEGEGEARKSTVVVLSGDAGIGNFFPLSLVSLLPPPVLISFFLSSSPICSPYPGKTVLLKEVLLEEKAAREDNIVFFSGAADSMDMGTPFFVWTDILLQLLELGKTKNSEALKGMFGLGMEEGRREEKREDGEKKAEEQSGGDG
jgi:hypothetical protein